MANTSQSNASLTVAVGGRGWGCRGGGPLCVTTEKNAPKYTQSHLVLGMKTWLKLNCLQKFMKITRTKLYIAIENFKIYQVEVMQDHILKLPS